MRVERNLRYDLHRTKQLCRAKQTDIRLLTNAWKLNSSQIKIHTKLASGAYGEVWKGSLRDRWIVAVKKMHESHKRVGRRHSSLAKSSSSAGRVFKDDEVRFLMRTRHERLVMFLGCGVDEKGVSFVVMEFMDGGSLDRALWRSSSNFANMSWLQRIRILLDVVDGLAYLHLMHKSIHQDLKSPNVLLEIDRHSVDHHDSSEQGGGETSSFRAKLGDFGLSRIVLKDKTRGKITNEIRESDKKAQGTANWNTRAKRTFVGTLRWMAPELMNDTLPRTSPACDIYSFAVLMWEMCALKRPWDTTEQREIIKRVRDDSERPVVTKKMSCPSKKYEDLMTKCWHQDSSRRPLVDVVRNEMHVVFELEAHDALSTISTTATTTTATTEEKMYDSCDDVSIEMQCMSSQKEEKVGEVDTSSSS